MYLYQTISTMYLLWSYCIAKRFCCFEGGIWVSLGTGLEVWVGLRGGRRVRAAMADQGPRAAWAYPGTRAALVDQGPLVALADQGPRAALADQGPPWAMVGIPPPPPQHFLWEVHNLWGALSKL